MDYILKKIENHIATISLNRPKKLNAFNSQMFRELTSCLQEAIEDKDVHVIMINSACKKAFTAGGDLQEEKSLTADTAEDFAHLGQKCMDLIYHCPIPVVAVLNGYSLGAAMEILLSADFTIASDDTIIGMPAINLAGITAFGGTSMLVRTVGRSRAAELLFTGRNITAQEALDLGMIEYVFKADELNEKAMEIISTMADRSPSTLTKFKKTINDGIDLPFEESRKYETSHFASAYDLPDRQEALNAFLEKRPHKPYRRIE